MNIQQFAKVFPLGSHLCREPMPPMSELKRDMENLKRHGFNLIKLQEHWALDEPVEGKYDFSRTQELIEHAARLDMGVYLGLTCEQAPGWLWRKYPDCRMVGRNGHPIFYEALTTLPADGKPGPCYDHPGARADMVRFISALVRDLGLYENIVVWNTWQEISYWAEGITGQQVCYCDNTLGFYREWLREKYGDLDSLNRAWNTRYADWMDIQPPRGSYGRDCQAQEINWQYFLENVQIARVLETRYRAIREADVLHRPVFAHKNAPAIGSGQDWTYARCQDFLGSSSYPAWGPFHQWDDGKPAPGQPFDRHEALLAEMWVLALSYDYIRSANGCASHTWAAEFQGGPVSTGLHKGRVPTPEDIRRWMLTAVASGVTGISFWVTRAEIMACEMNGFSLLDSERDTTARYEEASRVGGALNRYPELFAQPNLPQAEVAILVNGWNYQTCAALGDAGDHLTFSMRGWHRLLWDSGLPVDFVDVSELDEDYLHNYKALIVPFGISMSETVVAKLAAYVKHGGNLISEACPGRINEHGFCARGELSANARELFGVRHKSLTIVREPEGGTRWTPQERTWGEFADEATLCGTGLLDGICTRANLYLETFEPVDGSEAVLTCGDEIAGTVRKSGDGRAWLIGTFVGHSGTAYRSDSSREFVNALLSHCGIDCGNSGRLLVRRRAAGDREAWIITNPTAATVTEVFDIGGWDTVEDVLGGELMRDGSRMKIEVQSLDVRVVVLSKSR